MSFRRPEVLPVDPAVGGVCLCGEPAIFVVDMIWFGGRHSRDPVCERHIVDVVEAIAREQARLNGG
jgi:hypothetical protein